MKKVIYGVLAATAAMGIAFAAQPTDASAASHLAPASRYTLEGDVLTIKDSSQEVVQVLVSKGTLKKGAVVPGAWDVYDVDGTRTAKVDLSKYAKTADNYLCVKASFESDDDIVVLKLPKSDVIKAVYNKKTGEIDVTNKSDSNNEVDPSLVYYRLDSSLNRPAKLSSLEASSVDEASNTTVCELSKYQMSGGAVYVNLAQTSTVNETYPADETYSTQAVLDEDDNTPEDILLPKRASKEVKVTIAKRANAPKLVANYVKGTITVPAAAMYRTYGKGNSIYPGKRPWILNENTNPKNQKPKALDLVVGVDVGTDIGSVFAVDVYKPGEANKSIDSKVGHEEYAGLTATTVDTTALTYTVDVTKVKKADKTRVTVTNKDTENAYVLTWTDDAGNAKTTALAKAKSATKATEVKLVGVGYSEDTEEANAACVQINRAGVSTKTAKVWPGTLRNFVTNKNVSDALTTPEE